MGRGWRSRQEHWTLDWEGVHEDALEPALQVIQDGVHAIGEELHGKFVTLSDRHSYVFDCSTLDTIDYHD